MMIRARLQAGEEARLGTPTRYIAGDGAGTSHVAIARAAVGRTTHSTKHASSGHLHQ